jgi:hypothetical protein
MQCCATAKDQCLFKADDDPDKQEQCVAEYLKCGTKKPKGIPPPPSDFPKDGKLL